MEDMCPVRGPVQAIQKGQTTQFKIGQEASFQVAIHSAEEKIARRNVAVEKFFFYHQWHFDQDFYYQFKYSDY